MTVEIIHDFIKLLKDSQHSTPRHGMAQHSKASGKAQHNSTVTQHCNTALLHSTATQHCQTALSTALRTL